MINLCGLFIIYAAMHISRKNYVNLFKAIINMGFNSNSEEYFLAIKYYYAKNEFFMVTYPQFYIVQWYYISKFFTYFEFS